MSDTSNAAAPAAASPGSGSVGPLAEELGIRLEEATAERAVATMPVAGNTQPLGLLSGGASVVLGETLGSIAATLHAGPGRAAVGVDVNATHHRAVREGIVTGVATALHRGERIASYEFVVTDDEGRRVCTGRLTCLLVEVARRGGPAAAEAAEHEGAAPES